MTKLSSIADYVTDKISSNDIALREYVTTDCILQNKKGREIATNLPPQSCCLTRYQRGDVLIANIRPYLKKVWFADIDGGASSDVLVFRVKEGHSPSFLYAVLLQDSFFDYVMQGAKGSKMPRGDKEQILRYEMPTLSCSEESIGTFFLNLDQKIRLNEQINQNLEAMAKQLYDYWFVQFDFPDENGRPYKSSGGKMVWNEKLKREIPEGWDSIPIGNYAPCKGGYAFKSSDFCKRRGVPVIKIGNIRDDYTLDMTDCQCIENFDNSQFLAKRFDLVIAMTGATIGKFAISQRDYWVNQRVGRFELGDTPLNRLGYLFNSLKQDYFREQIFQIASGCAQPNISSEQIDAILILKPKDSILSQFNNICRSLLKQQSENLLQIEELTKQRDELLPLLMNGQVSVNSDLPLD